MCCLAERHQFHMEQHVFMYPQKPLLEVSNISTLSLDVLKNQEIVQAVRLKHPNMEIWTIYNIRMTTLLEQLLT